MQVFQQGSKKNVCGFEGVKIGDGHKKMVILIQTREASYRIRDVVREAGFEIRGIAG